MFCHEMPLELYPARNFPNDEMAKCANYRYRVDSFERELHLRCSCVALLAGAIGALTDAATPSRDAR